ncbi:MAG: hypothetical protein H0V84_01405 [Actinobacteria bacterium]|nr:hypothetical protein [Actinomycetota bacterium]
MRPTDVSEDQLAFIGSEILKWRGDLLEPTAFQKAIQDTCPILAAPARSDVSDDMAYCFRLAQMRDFWDSWDGSFGRQGPRPNVAAVKATMSTLAMSGIGAYLQQAHGRLKVDTSLQEVFAALGGGTFNTGSYPTIARNLERLSGSLPRLAMEANIAMLKELRQLHPKGGVGKRLLIDGFPVPAWCQQRGAGDRNDPMYARREALLSARTPEASFRYMAYSKGGKIDIAPYEPRANGLPAGHHKWWRGYYLVMIADQATGLPLVWTLISGRYDEAAAIVPLLSRLHSLWPDIGAELIAGDSAWAEEEWCRVCEVDYGIAPIFRLKPSQASKRREELKPGQSRDGSVVAMTGRGQLICSSHERPLDFHSAEVPSRLGLRPGQSSPEGSFRVRGEAPMHGHRTQLRPNSCGRLSLRMSTSWRRLTRYPHHPHGDPKRYAMREAMLLRLNQIEGIGNRLKSGLHLGSEGETRTRILSYSTVEGLFGLGCLSMTALALADQRIQLGIDEPLTAPNVLQLFPAAEADVEVAA